MSCLCVTACLLAFFSFLDVFFSLICLFFFRWYPRISCSFLFLACLLACLSSLFFFVFLFYLYCWLVFAAVAVAAASAAEVDDASSSAAVCVSYSTRVSYIHMHVMSCHVMFYHNCVAAM